MSDPRRFSVEDDLEALRTRLDELEIKASFSEQVTTELNDALAAASARVSVLEKQLQQLQALLTQPIAAEDPEPDSPPPHY